MLHRDSFKRGVCKLAAGRVAVYQTSLFAQDLSAVLCSDTEGTVLALWFDRVAEVFFLCHINIPSFKQKWIPVTDLFYIYRSLSLYHIFSFLATFFCEISKIVIINKNTDNIGELCLSPLDMPILLPGTFAFTATAVTL